MPRGRARPPSGGAIRGFTLVELLIALVLVGFIGIWLVRFVGAQQRAYSRQGAVVTATQNARAAAELFLAEARNAGFDPRGVGARITHATRDSFGWTADLNADGDVDDAGPQGEETVLYYYDAGRGAMMRRTAAYTSPMVESLDSLEFRYLDRQGRPTSTVGHVAAVEALIRFTALDGELVATFPASTPLPNMAGR